jgi:hypothetical protein
MKNGSIVFRILVLIAFSVLLAPNLYAQDNVGSADQLYGFAENLFNQGDYFRSITEYKRFIFYYPADQRVSLAAFGIGQSYFKAQRWSEAEESFQVFISQFNNSPQLLEALYLKALAQKNQNKFDQALSTLNSLEKIAGGEVRERSIFQKAMIFIERADWERANSMLKTIPPSSVFFRYSKIISQGLDNSSKLPHKDPVLAGALSALLPGAGQLYTERPRDALVAFLLNAAFITGAVQSFRHNNEITGGILSFFELGWYSGTIYSAIGSAHKFNERVKLEFIHKLKESSPISMKSDPFFPATLCLSYSITF